MSLAERWKWRVKLMTPYGLVMLREKRAVDRRIASQAESAPPTRDPEDSSYSVEEAVRFLLGRRIDERQLREGSMPKASLDFTGDLLRERLPRGRPLITLHVGNFVGVSLSYFTALVRDLHPDSVVVSIDPNIQHRGVEQPMRHVLALLNHFGLLPNSIVIPGYTLEQNLGDPWTDDLQERYLSEVACEQVVTSLGRLAASRFDLALLDGFHDAAYLEREFAQVRKLLADESIVVFDDVGVAEWAGVEDVFRRELESSSGSAIELGVDGRVGIMQLRPEVRA